MSDEILDRPKFIKIHEYVEQRATQVADLLQMVDNSNLVSGEVTKGPRTAAQRLPRHMRRRAMAYDVRRFPKGLRQFAAPFAGLSKHRKKPPSRFFRRRSRNMLLNYIRRQRKAVWLETHIWHAKRFHMIDRWGYRIPDRSYQRNFRPCYRDSVRHCSIRDKSYLTCFVISHPCQQTLISLLSPLCNAAVSPTFAFKSALGGRFEMSALLYEPGKYSLGFLGPVRFMWSQENDSHRLSIWVHPSCRDQLLAVLVSLLSVEKVEDIADSEPEKNPESTEEWRLQRMKVHTDVYKNADGKIELQDLRDQMVRLRLYGPRSMGIVADALKLVEGPAAEAYSTSHSEWMSQYSLMEAAEIRDGTVFSLLIEDPRLARIASKRLPSAPDVDVDECDSNHCTPQAAIWSRDVRMEVLEKKLSSSALQKLNGESVSESKQTPAKIPVLVIVRNGGSGKAETLDGVELVVPCGFGVDLWVELQLRTAHASGRRDELAAHLEARRFDFPTDAVDSRAGEREGRRVERELEEQHARRPHNRRVKHWKKMSIKYPFSFHLDELLMEWRENKKLSGATSSEPYVLRDRRGLARISDWLSGCGTKPADLLAEHSSSLVPVEIECVARGRPKQFALVCLPQKEDLDKLRRRHRDGPVIIVQSPRTKEEDKMDTENGTEVKKPSRDDVWKDVVSVDRSAHEKPISLKALFPEGKTVDKRLKRKLLNRVKKVKAKRRKLDREVRLRELAELEQERESTRYRDAASRPTIGRVVRGDYSFSAARGRALAFVPLCCLDDVRATGNVVLLRNISSKYFHPAKLSILRNMTEL